MYVEDNKILVLFIEDCSIFIFFFNFIIYVVYRLILKVVFFYNFFVNFNCMKDVIIEFFCFCGISLIMLMIFNCFVCGKGRGNKFNRLFMLMI